MVCRSERLLCQVLNQTTFRPNTYIEGINADYLLADRGYDSDAIITQAISQGMKAVIPLRKNRKSKRAYDKHLYNRIGS